VAVVKRYYRHVLNGTVNAFLIDLAAAYDQAYAAGDIEGHDALHRVWLDHFESYLGKMSGPELIAYLQGRQVWQQEGDWIIFATIDEPCSPTPPSEAQEITSPSLHWESAIAIQPEDVPLGGGMSFNRG
jgi:hypothetical protein